MADKKEVSLASLNVAQKVLAVDARYNSLRLMAYPRQSALVADSVYVASLWVVRTRLCRGKRPWLRETSAYPYRTNARLLHV